MGDHNREFSFSLALARDGQAYTEDLIYTENENSGEKTLRADKGVYQFLSLIHIFLHWQIV